MIPDLLQSLVNAMLTPGLGWTSRVVAAALKGVYQISRENGMQPGQDMLAAMEEADACGATIVYGDQVLTPSPPPHLSTPIREASSCSQLS